MPRLRTAAQFAAVLNTSKHHTAPITGIWRSTHFALHVAPRDSIYSEQKPPAAIVDTLIIGVVCPKRWAKRAVTRNTIKRQIYAVSSELQATLPSACYVVRLAAAFSREQFPSATSSVLKAVLRSELLALFRKLPLQKLV